jgi:hypothetical protein
MKKVKEFRVGGSTDFNQNGGWLKIKVEKMGNQSMISFYLGNDGWWNTEPLFSCDSHWIKEIIVALQNLDI